MQQIITYFNRLKENLTWLCNPIKSLLWFIAPYCTEFNLSLSVVIFGNGNSRSDVIVFIGSCRLSKELKGRLRDFPDITSGAYVIEVISKTPAAAWVTRTQSPIMPSRSREQVNSFGSSDRLFLLATCSLPSCLEEYCLWLRLSPHVWNLC